MHFLTPALPLMKRSLLFLPLFICYRSTRSIHQHELVFFMCFIDKRSDKLYPLSLYRFFLFFFSFHSIYLMHQICKLIQLAKVHQSSIHLAASPCSLFSCLFLSFLSLLHSLKRLSFFRYCFHPLVIDGVNLHACPSPDI